MVVPDLRSTANAANESRRPRRLTAGDKDSEPRWSPDGKWIAFTAKRKDDAEPQVYRIAPDGGEAERVTNVATGAAAIKWFPDSRRIAFVSWMWPDLTTDAAQAQAHEGAPRLQGEGARVRARAPRAIGTIGSPTAASRTCSRATSRTGHNEDLLQGLKLALPPWDPSAEDYDISPDGRQLAITATWPPSRTSCTSATSSPSISPRAASRC